MHGRRTAPAKLRKIREGENPWYEITITEGRQNQIRVMFKHFGFLVEKLKRTRIGFLDLAGLKPGAYRTLTNHEVEKFKKLIGLLEQENESPVRRVSTGAAPKRRRGTSGR
jgi:23S rRNA pseudouridine2605 synthase